MNLATIFFLIVLSSATLTLASITDRRDRQIGADAAQNTIVQLAQAQHRAVTDPDRLPFGTYIASPDLLRDGGYLASWTGDSRYTFDFPTADSFEVEFAADTLGLANKVAIRFGETAAVNGTTVEVGFASPLDLSLFDVYVRKAGDEMFGSLNMRNGSGANINMNDNDINSQGNAIFRNGTGTANIDTDTANADSLTVQTFRVVN